MRRSAAASPARPASSRTSCDGGSLNVKVVVTGATGTIGRAVVRALRSRGDEVVALSRSPDRARSVLGSDVQAVAWESPKESPAPAEAFSGADGAVHLLGEPVSQR